MLKRLFSILSISLILIGVFFNSYNVNALVYADSVTDEWTDVTTNGQLVEAFKYYCKSRDLTIEGSVADTVTSFTTKNFNNACNFLGIDITALQAEVKYRTGNNIGTQFLFTATGVNLFNRIFSQFLQDNELQVGDEEVNKQVYSGYNYDDGNGNSCLVYIVSVDYSTLRNNTDFEEYGTSANPIIYYGTKYIYDEQDLSGLNSGYSFYVPISSSKITINKSTVNTGSSKYQHQSELMYLRFGSSTTNFVYNRMGYYDNFYVIDSEANPTLYSYGKYFHGNLAIIKTSDDVLCWGTYSEYIDWSNDPAGQSIKYDRLHPVGQLSNANVQNASVYIYAPTINNNTYEGDTIINNNGDVINNNPVYPDPNPNPTPDPPTIPDDDGWQDFTLPEMPNDWLIYGMERKFPFDIPFNILFGLSLLNHEPEIPQFEGDIDLKVCTWHYDIDLTPFDDIAKILRKFEVLAFIIGLAMITKELIMWG